EEHGLEFVDELEGMFGLALWDATAQRLVLARDRMGEKPLYYASTSAGLLFASEPKAILASGLVDRAADPVAIAGFRRTGYVAAPGGRFVGISALVPGTQLVVEGEGARVVPFWEVAPFLAAPPLALDLESAARELRRQLQHAVEAALVSDVPVGVFLSGGLDSTAVAGGAPGRRGPGRGQVRPRLAE